VKSYLVALVTKAEIQAKVDATRLENLLAKKALKKPFTQRDNTVLKRLQTNVQKGS
jgi:hypothetical protein